MADMAASVLARLKNKAAESGRSYQLCFENRGHHFTVEQFEQVMTFGSDDAMQKKWKAFCRKIDTKADNFDTVLRTIKAFLAEPYTSALMGRKLTEYWSAPNNDWRII
jgi:hypothetical protein